MLRDFEVCSLIPMRFETETIISLPHGARGEYTKVWIPLHIAKAIKIKPNKSVPVLLSGWTIPEREVIKEYPVVKVEHLKQDFNTEWIGKQYRWVIPSVIHFIPFEDRKPLEIKTYEIFNHALKQGVMPLAEFHIKKAVKLIQQKTC